MKTLFTLVNSTLLLTICGTVFSQSGDAALAGINYQNEINSNKTKTKKVGPQGEELILKGNRFYYLNEKGKKVKVRKNDLKSRPKHS